MRRVFQKPALQLGRVVFALLLALGHLPPADAQNVDVASSTEALTRVAELGNTVRAMRAVVAIPLGPYEVSTRCTWCSKEFIGICFENTTQSWSTTVDFSWTRSRLNRVLAQAEQSANDFPRAFASMQAWIDGIPAFTARFAKAADIITNVEQQIKTGQGPSEQQRQAVTQALQALISDFANTTTQLDNGTRTLAAALQEQSGYGPAIRQATDGADQSATAALSDLENQANVQRCRDGLSDKFNAIRASFGNSTRQISAAFQTLEASRQASDRGLAALLGILVSSRTDVQSIADQLAAVTNDKLGGFLERLHLASAKQQWQQVADYAAARLSRVE
jgi:hypothetical protein